jgi:hypothetical protein
VVHPQALIHRNETIQVDRARNNESRQQEHHQDDLDPKPIFIHVQIITEGDKTYPSPYSIKLR